MLVSLTLHQFALIAQHELSVAEGFNVITGETGAGKSLLLDALSLCVGERAERSHPAAVQGGRHQVASRSLERQDHDRNGRRRSRSARSSCRCACGRSCA